LFVVTFDGQVIVHGTTVTVNMQELILLLASVAVQVTVVAPIAKQVPDGGAHTAVAPGQLSVGVGVVNVTVAHPAPVETLMLAGHEIEGF
jgi:hypothetical protein